MFRWHKIHSVCASPQVIPRCQSACNFTVFCRNDASTLHAQVREQTSIAHSLRRDLAGASMQVQDLRSKRDSQHVAKERQLWKDLEEKNETIQRQIGEISALRDLSERYRGDMEAQLAETQYAHQLLDASQGVEADQREELKKARQKWQSGVRAHREQLANMEDKVSGVTCHMT